MGNECSACSCNDQKEVDTNTALYLEKKKLNGQSEN
jgi:hypothetical protein